MFLRRITIPLSVLLAAGACGGTPKAEKADGPSTTVAVELSEFALDVAPGTAPTGPVTFEVSHTGQVEHNLTVLRTDLAPDALPLGPGGEADTMAQGIEVLTFTPPLGFGSFHKEQLDLQPGSYVLICNVADHYQRGMHADFTVG